MGKATRTTEIAESAAGVDLNAHVGQKVTITGTRLSASAAAKTEGEEGTKEERGESHLRADSVKMVAATCS